MLDMEFKSTKYSNFLDVSVNIVNRGEHVKRIERFYRLIEERARCYYAILPLNYLPRMMVIHLLIIVVFYINAFSWTKWLSKVLSLLIIVQGIMLDFNLHFRVTCGIFSNTRRHRQHHDSSYYGCYSTEPMW